MLRRSTPILWLLGILSCRILYPLALNLNCLWCCRDPDDPQSNDANNNNPAPKPPIYRPCKDRSPGNKGWAPDGGWACDHTKVDFPTVECLAADMMSCGNVGNNSVFYSFGARTEDVRPFRDTLNPKGTMFNDALDDYYVRAIAPLGNDWFHLSDITVRGTSGLNYNMNRQDIFTARYSEALAQVSSDTAYIVVLRYEGDGLRLVHHLHH